MGRLWMPRSDMTMRLMFLSRGTWETEESAFLGHHIAPSSTVVNVGANVGYTSLVLSRIVGPTGHVIALEPEPLNFKLLCVNTAGAGNVLPIHTAAGETTGSIRLNLSATNAGDHRTAPHENAVCGIEVPMVALDDLLADRTIAAIVSDTQGFDHRVVAGASDLISRCHPVITVEFWPDGIRNVGDDPGEVLRGYQSLGYSRMIDVPNDRDLTGSSVDEIIAASTSTMDHTTLALLP
jgi:FkbM family methyltransferase